MLVPVAGPSTTAHRTMQSAPEATANLLKSLAPVHSTYFPCIRTPTRPETNDANTPELKEDAKNKVALLKSVLGTYFSDVELDLLNATKEPIETSDKLLAFTSVLPGSLHGLSDKPRWLLYTSRSTTAPQTLPTPSLVNGSPVAVTHRPNQASTGPDAGNPEEDFATWFTWQALRLDSALEHAVLDFDRVDTLATRDSQTRERLQKERKSLQNEIERTLVGILEALTKSAVRIPWRGAQRDDPARDGGVGKAREIIEEMLKLAQGLVPSTHHAYTTYPKSLSMFATSKAYQAAGRSPSKGDIDDVFSMSGLPPVIDVRSPTHARSLVLVILRILLQATAGSIVLANYRPTVINLLVSTWPSPASFASVDAIRAVSRKGKEREVLPDEITQVRQILTAQWLALARLAVNQAVGGGKEVELQLIAQQVAETFSTRLGEAESARNTAAMDLDDETSRERRDELDKVIDKSLFELTVRIHRDCAVQSQLGQLYWRFLATEGETLVSVLFNDQQQYHLRACSLLLLAYPLSHPSPALSTSCSPLDLLSFASLRLLDQQLQKHAECPLSPASGDHQVLVTTAYSLVLADHDNRNSIISERAAVEAQNNNTVEIVRKRRRLEGPDVPSSDSMMETDEIPGAAKRRREKKMAKNADGAASLVDAIIARAVRRSDNTLKQILESGDLTESLDSRIARLIESLLELPEPSSIDSVHTIGLIGCARSKSSASVTVSDSKDPLAGNCMLCDTFSPSANNAVQSIQSDTRVLTTELLTAFDQISARIFDNKHVSDKLRLNSLMTIQRIIRHTKLDPANGIEPGNDLIDAIFRELDASSRSVRVAAGSVLLAIVAAQQEHGSSMLFVRDLFKMLDGIMFRSAQTTETALHLIGQLAKVAEPQGLLECESLARMIRCLGNGNAFLKSKAKLQLAQTAEYRGIRPYALVQPHFAALGPVIVSSRSTLKASLDSFHQSRDMLLRVTREYTIPELILSSDPHYRKTLLEDIATASGRSVPGMFIEEAAVLANVVARLFMEEDVIRDRGVKALEAASASPIRELLTAGRVPIAFALALELGDEDDQVRAKAETALINVERTRIGSPNAKVSIGKILKNAIVGILSFMNNGLREARTLRPLRDKQKIVRSLSAVTLKVGSGISGFSPQIMATLQTALSFPGLRMTALEAFKSFMTSGRFSDVGVFISPVSSSFVHIWPELDGPEKGIASEILTYIVENREGFKNYMQDVADLSHLPELAGPAAALKKLRRKWTFEDWTNHLLERIRGENDAVTTEALKELRELMAASFDKLQALSFGDSFDPNVGRIVEVLLGAAVKDGSQFADIRNIACECIGLLGAVDPDRFELPPVQEPPVVLENFENHEESVRFALRLIQDLLVGAYRSTNDTKHQEFLAVAIQELLKFCGFTDANVGPGASETTVDQAKQQIWADLPADVKQACGPLLSTRFQLSNLPHHAPAQFPIYLSTASFRDWVRCFAVEIYRKIQGQEALEIFKPFEGLLQLEDSAVPQYLLPHLVLNALICGSEDDRNLIKNEMEVVLTDQVSPTHNLPENSRLLAAQTIFALMDHLSRWITLARKRIADLKAARKKGKTKTALDSTLSNALIVVEGVLQDIPHILVGQAALTCKSYARSLLNFESHIVAQRAQKGNAMDKDLQAYYENLHECYADLDEPDGMEGISTKILAPSILHQIREHESTGRWTSAQSCWEVKLQQKPDDAANHVGLLRCLRNLGHYDSMRTHITGLLSSRGDEVDWERILAPFNIEASLFVGDWAAVEDTLNVPELDGPEAAFGRVLCAMRAGDEAQVDRAFFEAREQLGGPIVAAGRESYRRVYDSVVHLHVLNELRTIHQSRSVPSASNELVKVLQDRLNCTSPSFRAREPILNLRRTAFRLAPPSDQAARIMIGDLWLESSKIARKAGHSQTAYSAILQVRDCSADFAYYQSAKLLKASGQTYKAIQELDNRLKPILANFNRDDPDSSLVIAGRSGVTPLAKAALRRARWMLEAGRVEQNAAIALFKDAGALSAEWESPLYYLGRYWDQLADAERPPADTAQKGTPVVHLRNGTFRTEVVRLYAEALRHGTKYIYQALPRMLTIWLEMSETPGIVQYAKLRTRDPKAAPPSDEIGDLYRHFSRLNDRVSACAGAGKNAAHALPTYQWLTVLPQLVSRILHPNERVVNTLEIILLKVLKSYPHHGFWAMASGAKSMTSRRSKRNSRVLQKAKEAYLAGHESSSANVAALIEEGLKLVQELLLLCDYNITGKVDSMSLKKSFPSLYSLLPAQIIIPLQNSLTVSLPFDASQAASHKPFPDDLPTFHSFEDQITIMSSLQKPRKITIRGSDGQLYSFLCKPKDDLRKDARLMEFNAMIIKLLKKDSEARSRKLSIRTYSVVPLNEECGLIEWVPHVVVLRGVLNKAYSARGIASWSPELKKIFDTIRDVPKKTGERFENEVLAQFPPVFHDWFLENFPEPSAWHRARLAYSRTAAVISMVGFVLGLGDRHCENILLDGTTGDTVHVDFNCLFDKGRTFEVAEKVPFRLTANIIDGMGVTGIEGVYRRSAEIALRILRANKDSLRSVLETFLHDPLVEWISRKSTASTDQTKVKALESLEPISNKLRGLQVTSDPKSLGAKEVTVEEQVERLIREARDPANLGSMYVGWCAWY
ncbi:protein kinase MEC1 [Sporobolomyces koalae]|uniref:protein kinase MEC1 n=1 Tax=Sporobolomyces koalae TaxID=500713 RepID=UPI00316FE7F1